MSSASSFEEKLPDDVEMLEIELTEKQEEVADWLMGCPVIDEWHSTEQVLPEFERGHLPQPELEDGVFRLPDNEDLIWYLAHPSYGDSNRYGEMAYEAAELSTREAQGEARAASNLGEKIREASSHDVV